MTQAALAKVPGVTPAAIAQGARALQQAYADAIRIIFIIAVPFGVVACITCCFLGDLKETMNYHVDAPVEELHAKHGPPRPPRGDRMIYSQRFAGIRGGNRGLEYFRDVNIFSQIGRIIRTS